MRALSLFSGIGGIDLACEWAGIETVAFCEWEAFPQKVLKKHWPNVPVYGDVRDLTKERLEADGIIGAGRPIDIIHGGYPCQPFSTAGERKGKDDDRHLWPEVRRLIETIRPHWFVGENVAGHVSLGLDEVLSDLGNLGYATQSFIIPACAVNAPHRRDRVFIVANSMCGILGTKQESKYQDLGRGQDFMAYGKEQFLARPIVSDTSSEGLQECGRSKRPESTEEARTGVESKSERCGENVAYSNSSWELQQKGNVQKFGGWTGYSGKADGYEQWSVEPDVGRVANGVPNRVDRLKALGNAVVPQQIYPIFAAIMQIEAMSIR